MGCSGGRWGRSWECEGGAPFLPESSVQSLLFLLSLEEAFPQTSHPGVSQSPRHLIHSATPACVLRMLQIPLPGDGSSHRLSGAEQLLHDQMGNGHTSWGSKTFRSSCTCSLELTRGLSWLPVSLFKSHLSQQCSTLTLRPLLSLLRHSAPLSSTQLSAPADPFFQPQSLQDHSSS